MKKFIMLMLTVVIGLMVSGCVASEVYEKAKPVYKAGKAIIKVSPITDETRSRLKKLDGEVTDYDTVRNVVKPIIQKRVILK